LLADFEFQIHYKKNNENDEADTLVDDLIMKKWNEFTLKFWAKTMKFSQKNLAATYRVKNASLMNDKLIWECHNDRVSEHFEVKKIKNLVWRKHNISDFRN
jgi:hypothetical protein